MLSFSDEEMMIMLAVDVMVFSVMAGWDLQKGFNPRNDVEAKEVVDDNADDSSEDCYNCPSRCSGEGGKRRVNGWSILSFFLRCGIALFCMFWLFRFAFA